MLKVLLAALIALGLGGGAAAQDWPTRPITLVVPFPAGGPIDFIGRLMAQKLSEQLGQQVIVENVGGAGGMNGAARVAKSPPDGSMFLFGNQGTHTFSQLLYKKPLYNAVTDFAPVGGGGRERQVPGRPQGFPGQDACRVHRLCQGEPEDHAVRLGRHRLGDACHLRAAQPRDRRRHHACALSRHRPGAAGHDRRPHRLHVRGDLDRRAACAVDAIKALAILSPTRNAALPDVPTAHEQGLKDFDADGWNAFFFPRGTPDAIVRKLAQATSAILDMPDVRERLEKAGLNVALPERRTPEYLGKLVVSELDKWGPPVRASGVIAD